MSQRSQPKDRPDGESHGTPNGVSTVDGVGASASTSNGAGAGAGAGPSVGAGDGVGTENSNVDIAAPHFGIFHDEIVDIVQKLRPALAVIDGAVGDLSKTFDRYGKIVTTVGERYEKDEELVEQIRILKIENAGIWKHIFADRDKYEKEKSELQAKHETEMAALDAQAKAGEQEKKKYEEMKKALEEKFDKGKQKLKNELQQRAKQLETDNAEKIKALENDKQELQSENARLTKELNERTRERDEEKLTRETMQTKLRGDVTALEKELTGMKAKYQVNRQPSEYYRERYGQLTDRVSHTATVYFADLSEGATEDPVGTWLSLIRRSSNFENVPIADSPCSRYLRLAISQHIIFDAIHNSVWQPFFSQYLWKHTKDRATTPTVLREIYSRLGADGADFQHNWKVSTLKILGQLDEKTDVGRLLVDMIEAKVVSPLKPLLDDAQVDSFRNDLKELFTDAIALGREAERDQSMVYVETVPSMMKDPEGWKEYLGSSEEYDTSDATDPSAVSPASEISPEPLFVSPKIFRGVEDFGAEATATGGSKVELIQMGVALYPDTGIFLEGALEWQRIRGASKEAAKNNGSPWLRRSSTSTTATGLGISPRSPSHRWSRRGTQDFD
ncbi:hypothetical protein PV04_08952 [Phialophora macrospora]|uniref:Uncharacterized protein n=1 Tax=Phialophora macrospora TaxID=1851006 RepID=A0A0D2DP41_9EURO|nr:hypothetical protein PV04_08952 [Phialophora macrospora]